ncbi:AAA family ATPase, partial [Pontimicrobium sp. MEBiC01747]
MIKTTKIKEPAFFKSARAKVLKNRIARHFSKPIEARSQTKFPVEDIEAELADVERELLEKTNHKCAYCESPLTLKGRTIDHYRPNYSAADTSGLISQEHYWWLAVIWNNLFPVCIDCKHSKSNYFPVLKNRTSVRYYGKEALYNVESPVFIDPEYENPEHYFYYDEKGRIYSKTKRGNITIDILDLNRRKLVASRQSALEDLDQYIGSEIKETLEPSQFDKKEEYKIDVKLEGAEQLLFTNAIPFSGILRYFLRQYFLGPNRSLELNNAPSKFKKAFKINIKEDDEAAMDNQFSNWPTKFKVDSIAIRNYKSIDNLNIKFNRTEKRNAGWAILIGENGVGKSSALSATLKALIGRDYYGLTFKKEEIKRHQNEDAEVSLLFNSSTNNYVVNIGNKITYSLPKNYFIEHSIIAFGPFKHANKKLFGKNRFKGGCFVDNFFNPAIPLHNALNFILQLSENQFNYVSIAILDLLMLENKAIINRDLENHKVWYTYNETGIQHYFNELSDGYQSVITLGCNIIEGLLRNNESIANASGFVVIDEIGANLHPRWKMQIVKRLRRTFPNVQFLVTTHDPLCLKGIEANETYVLKSNNGKLEVLNDLPNPSEFRADQLLTSEFFGLYSTVDPEMETAFKAYYELLYKPEDSRTPKDNKRLKALKKELKAKNHLGNSLREELLYVAI